MNKLNEKEMTPNQDRVKLWEIIKPAREARRPFGLRALGLLLADGTPTVGCPDGGRLFESSAKFFYGNSSNSGTESRKIVSKVGN